MDSIASSLASALAPLVAVLKRLFHMQPTESASQPETLQIPFAQPRPAVRVTHSDPQAIITALGLPSPIPTIFVSGGASNMEAESVNALRSVIEDGLVHFLSASETEIALIDGGTASGVMQLIGVARQRRNCQFPLIGVTPDALVKYPGVTHPLAQVSLDSGHSHFVLTGGDHFGSESETIIDLAYTLSGKGREKRLGIVLSGGEIVRKEAHRISTHEPRFPLLVLEGSGRFADELAAARTTGSSDPMIQDILNKGRVYFISAKAGADNLYRWLENFFGY